MKLTIVNAKKQGPEGRRDWESSVAFGHRLVFAQLRRLLLQRPLRLPGTSTPLARSIQFAQVPRPPHQRLPSAGFFERDARRQDCDSSARCDRKTLGLYRNRSTGKIAQRDISVSGEGG